MTTKLSLDKLSIIISALTSPFLTALVIPILVIYHSYIPAEYQKAHLFAVLWTLCIVLLPASYIGFNIKRGHITDIHVPEREKRLVPFVIAILGAIFLLVLYRSLGATGNLIELCTVMIVNGLLFLLITAFWKISVHAAGFAGSIVIATLYLSPASYWLFLLTPVVLWARVHRKRHNWTQGIVASILAFLATLITIMSFGT